MQYEWKKYDFVYHEMISKKYNYLAIKPARKWLLIFLQQ